MAAMKFKDIEKMGQKEMEEKMKELKLELVKSKAGANKAGSAKVKQIKKMIARLHTAKILNSQHGNMSKMRPA